MKQYRFRVRILSDVEPDILQFHSIHGSVKFLELLPIYIHNSYRLLSISSALFIVHIVFRSNMHRDSLFDDMVMLAR